MSMPETPPPAAPKKRSAKRKSPPRAIRPTNDLAGLTVADCPTACGIAGCVISGNGICAHPRKGGLQGRTMQDNAALERFNRAQKMLGKKTVDARFA